MADIATMRMKALHFWDKHGISAASEAFGVSAARFTGGVSY